MNYSIKAILFLMLNIFFSSIIFSQKMYWASEGKIKRADLDGTNIEDIILDSEIMNSATEISGVAIDTSNNKLYWTTEGALKRADLDGQNQEEILSISTGFPDIAINQEEQKIYMTSSSSLGKLWKSNLDGTNLEQIIDSDEASSALGISLDPTAEKIYWVGGQGLPTIYSADLNGENIQFIGGGGTSGSTDLDIEVDYVNNYLYWTQVFDSKIYRKNIGSPGNETWYDDPNSTNALLNSLEFEPIQDKIYWTAVNIGFKTIIGRANSDGSNIEIFEFPETQIGGIAIDNRGLTTTYVKEPLSDYKLKIYPTPTSDYVAIEFDSPINFLAQLTIYNSIGDLIKSTNENVTIGINSMNIDLSDFPSGTYYFKLITDKFDLSERFIKLL